MIYIISAIGCIWLLGTVIFFALNWPRHKMTTNIEDALGQRPNQAVFALSCFAFCAFWPVYLVFYVKKCLTR